MVYKVLKTFRIIYQLLLILPEKENNFLQLLIGLLVFVNSQVELSCPKEMAWKVNMHRGYLAICHPEEQQLNYIERLVEMASSLAIREWRRLPHIVSHVHTPLLQVSDTTWIRLFVFC